MRTKILQKLRSGILILTIVLIVGFKENKTSSQINDETAGLAPYAIDYYAASNSFVVSSLKKGQLGTMDIKGKYTVLCDDPRLTNNATWGVKTQENLAKVCIGPSLTSLKTLNKSTVAKLATIDLATGKYISDVDLTNLKPGGPFGSIATSLTYDPTTSDIYVTDMLADVIYKVPNKGKAVLFSSSPLFLGCVPKGKISEHAFGLTGIAFATNCLLVSNFTKGLILKVSMDGKTVTPVQVDTSFSFIGINDLLVGPAGTLIMVNSKMGCIYELKSIDNWETASLIAINPTNYHSPIAAALAQGKIFILAGTNPIYTVAPYVQQIDKFFR